MRAQRVAVDVDPVEHDCAYREYHAERCKLSLSQNVMDQAEVETSVAVLERMDVDETESVTAAWSTPNERLSAQYLKRTPDPLL